MLLTTVKNTPNNARTCKAWAGFSQAVFHFSTIFTSKIIFDGGWNTLSIWSSVDSFLLRSWLHEMMWGCGDVRMWGWNARHYQNLVGLWYTHGLTWSQAMSSPCPHCAVFGLAVAYFIILFRAEPAIIFRRRHIHQRVGTRPAPTDPPSPKATF